MIANDDSTGAVRWASVAIAVGVGLAGLLAWALLWPDAACADEPPQRVVPGC